MSVFVFRAEGPANCLAQGNALGNSAPTAPRLPPISRRLWRREMGGASREGMRGVPRPRALPWARQLAGPSALKTRTLHNLKKMWLNDRPGAHATSKPAMTSHKARLTTYGKSHE